MATFEVDIDGATYEVDAPDETTAWQWANQTHAQNKPSKMQQAGEGALNFGKGLLSGAADIGNTLINASTFLPRQLETALGGNTLNQWNEQRQQGLENFNQQNADSTAFKAGRIGGNIAGTMGAGGAVGNVLKALSKTPQAAAIAQAIASGGSGGGNLATNVAGGAANAAVSGALINPELSDVGTDALIGGAFPVVGAAAPKIGSQIANALGLSTGAGSDAIKTAARSGMRGGQVADDFAANMRGRVPITDVLDTAKQNLATIRAQRGEAYRSGMVDLSKDKSILDFNPIVEALKKESNVGNFKGKIINASTADTQSKIKAIVEDWGSANPAEFHTPEGLDALKRAIGDVRESTQFGTPSRKVADSIYNAIKGEVNKQAPTYAKTMKDYSDASELISEIEGALSLGNKASADTSIRKLQSLMRNNVNTNYGRRAELAQALEQGGGQEILPAIAGQQLNDVSPRGLQRVLAGATGIGGLATLDPALLATLPLQSPRIVGETALATGKAARGIKKGYEKVSPAIGAIAAALQR